MITISNKFTKNLILPLAVAGNFFISETKVFTQSKDNKKPAMIEIIDKDNNTIPEELDKQMVKEYPYKNHGERINLMSQVEHKFDKVIVVEEEKKIKCYNKSKKTA